MESLLIVLWECSCPLLNEFYRKRPVMEYPQCKINLLRSSGLIILRALAAGGGGVDVTRPPRSLRRRGSRGAAGLRGSPVTDQGGLPRFGGVTARGAGWGVGVLCLEVNRLFLETWAAVLPDTAVPACPLRPRSRRSIVRADLGRAGWVSVPPGLPTLQPPGTPGPGLCLSRLLHPLLVGPSLASLLTSRPPVP